MARRKATVNHPVSSDRGSSSLSDAPNEVQEEEAEEHGRKSAMPAANLNDLVFLGRLEKQVEIFDYKFSVTTLTTLQQKNVIAQIMKSDVEERLLEVKPRTLAHAVLSVNGVPLEELCNDDSISGDDNKRLAVVTSWQSVLVERLFNEYQELVEQTNKDFEVQDLKKL